MHPLLAALKSVLGRWALIYITVVCGLLPGGGAFAAPEPEDPVPSPTAQPEPEEPPPPTATLMVYTTVLTEQPRSGNAVKVQVWVTATGAPADNVTLLLDTGADTTLIPQCTLAPTTNTTCRLGTLDAQGVTVPLTLQTPRSTTARTITLTATAAAAPSLPAQTNTTIALAPAAAIPAPKPTKTTPVPKPTKTTRSPKPVATTPIPQPSTSPAAPVVPPPIPATVPTVSNPSPYTPDPSSPAVTLSSIPALPQIAPNPASTFPNGGIVIAPPSSPSSSPLTLTPVSSTLTAAHSLWLGALLTAIVTTLLLARRRARSHRPRTKTKSRSGRRRYTPQGSHRSHEQETHGQLTELPTAISEKATEPIATYVSRTEAEEIKPGTAAHESLGYFNTISVAFDGTEPKAVEQGEADWHGVPIEVEPIGKLHASRSEAAASHAVQESRFLSWTWASITKSMRTSPATETDSE